LSLMKIQPRESNKHRSGNDDEKQFSQDYGWAVSSASLSE
jgi:hypothetical protein